MAYEAFLEANPDWQARVVLLMVVVPSRTGRRRLPADEVEDRRAGGDHQRQVRHALVDPGLYQYRSFPQEDLIPLYNASDVMLVTPCGTA
jgi:trehalose 6-phosphate synthase/phosphatase